MNESSFYEAESDLDRIVWIVDASRLTLDLLSALQTGSNERSHSRVEEDASTFRHAFGDTEPSQPASIFHSRLEESEPRKPPPWRIAFTKRFNKDIAELDRNRLGQILETLRKLSSLAWPLKPQGDTFKPLTGELKGMWRYRLGDYRLVVKPVLADSELDLVTFAARGTVYD